MSRQDLAQGSGSASSSWDPAEPSSKPRINIKQQIGLQQVSSPLQALVLLIGKEIRMDDVFSKDDNEGGNLALG